MSRDNGDVIIRTEHLSKIYPDGQVNALVDVNITIHRSEYVAIMGPSGSGKSTLLSTLGALDRPTSGDVVFDGQSLAKMNDLDGFRSAKIGFVFQSFYLLPTLSALENVQIPMFEGPLPLAERVRRATNLLERVGMGHRLHHLPMKLSIGERQRVALARALANDPLLLFADEPTGNLDSKTESAILDMFAELQRDQGVTLVVVTHSEEVASRAERTIRIRDGRVESDGT
ncbi:MAG: ABC transporter ATP-binding protein [Pirellulaceae bacterium]